MSKRDAGEVLFGDQPSEDGEPKATHYADRMMDAMGAEAFDELFVSGGEAVYDEIADEEASEEDGEPGGGEADESEEEDHGEGSDSGRVSEDDANEDGDNSGDEGQHSTNSDGVHVDDGAGGGEGVVNDSGSLSDPRYLELRDAHNRALWEKQQLERQLAERDAAANEIRQADAPTTEQLVAYAAEDVHGAFSAAFEHGDGVAIQQIIAQVNQAAYRMASRAEVAASEGDERLAAEADAQSLKLARMAIGMQDSYQAALRQAEADRVIEQYEANLAPFREERLVTNLRSAAQEAFAALDGFNPTPEQVQQMNEYIRQHEAQSVGRGHREAVDAFQRAAINVVYGGQAGYVDHLVGVRLAQAQAQQQTPSASAPPPRGASGGVGGSGLPPTPSPKSADDSVSSSRRRRDLGDPYKQLFG